MATPVGRFRVGVVAASQLQNSRFRPSCFLGGKSSRYCERVAATSLMLEGIRGHDANVVVIVEEDDVVVREWKVGCRSGRLS